MKKSNTSKLEVPAVRGRVVGVNVLEVGLVALIEISLGWVGGIHAGVSSRNIAKSPQQN